MFRCISIYLAKEIVYSNSDILEVLAQYKLEDKESLKSKKNILTYILLTKLSKTRKLLKNY